jgi:hypothetical protein
MSSQLSEENIELVESFIQNNKANIGYPSLSYIGQEEAIYYLQEISKEETPVTSYYLFASNAFGMTSYGYYKSKEGQIYIIEAFIQGILGYYNVDNDWDFLTRCKTDF